MFQHQPTTDKRTTLFTRFIKKPLSGCVGSASSAAAALALLPLALSLPAQAAVVSYIDEEHPVSRFEVNGDGTVTDTVTGLMWAQCEEGLSGALCDTGASQSQSWVAALSSARSSDLAGYNDWRLPNVKELQSLVAYNRVAPMINEEAFPNASSDDFWTSSPNVQSPGETWFVDFDLGYVDYQFRSVPFKVRLVRSGIDETQVTAADVQDNVTPATDAGGNEGTDGLDPRDAHIQGLIANMGLTGDPTTGRNLPSIDSPLAQLGKALFFARNLGGEQEVACASCHHPALGGGDNLSFSVGTNAEDLFGNGTPNLLGVGRHHSSGYPLVGRNANSVFNIGMYDVGLFWDSRVQSQDGELAAIGARGTEAGIITPDSPDNATPDTNIPVGASLANAQARFPVTDAAEMRGEFAAGEDNQTYRATLAARLASDELAWAPLFEAAYGDNQVTFDRIAEAIATYQESMVFINNPWKAFLEGNSDALTAEQKDGAITFYTEVQHGGAGCAECHSGDFFTNELPHVIATPQIGPGKGDGENTTEDFGRERVTGNSSDRYKFRTPTLLNVEVTAPYMHTGVYTSLDAVMDHYNDPAFEMQRLFGVNVRSQTATFDESGTYCELPQIANAMAKTGLSCAEVYDVLNPNAIENSREALMDVVARGSTAVLQNIDISDYHLGAMTAFMRSLTDPCVLDRACLDPWIIDSDNQATFPDSFPLIGVDESQAEL
ncbi:hypothetical protein GCM10007877_32720 [Marinibactrum halimedae]|uniref:Cytochrome c domain-containing protein n=2 Tax=Marinibactrum halimedae TaxID=1444977 RepID=A0AA37T9Y3_9GAMM|nr:hypothetical protein GCM10007877_32720 [Marinibactrum halimedae]